MSGISIKKNTRNPNEYKNIKSRNGKISFANNHKKVSTNNQQSFNKVVEKHISNSIPSKINQTKKTTGTETWIDNSFNRLWHK